MEDTRIISLNIVVSNPEAAEKLNGLLHEYSQHIIGRMGIPYRERGVSIITVVLDASDDVGNALSGRVGMIAGVECKTVRAKLGTA